MYEIDMWLANKGIKTLDQYADLDIQYLAFEGSKDEYLVAWDYDSILTALWYKRQDDIDSKKSK